MGRHCRTCDGWRGIRGLKKGGIAMEERMCRNCIGVLELDLRTLYKFYYGGKRYEM